MLCGRNVLDDEDFFAGLDKAELAARHFFDGRGIVAKPLRAVPQAAVLGALARDLSGLLVVLAAGAEHGEQPAIAHEAVDDDQHGDEQHDPAHDAAAASRRGAWLRCPALRRRIGPVF